MKAKIPRVNSARSYNDDGRPTHIYLLEDPSGVSSKKYVGMTVSPEGRLKGHMWAARIGELTYKARWVRSLLARGVTPSLSILEIVPAGGDFAGAERYWIAKLREEGTILVNLTDGGEGTRGSVLSPEHKARIGAAQRGRKHSMESIEKVRDFHKGRKRSPETCAKMSVAMTGKKRGPHSLEHRMKLSASKLGKKRPLEVMEKLREANIGRSLSPEHKEKLSLVGKGRKLTPEHRERLSIALTGRVKTLEHQMKISAANRNRSKAFEENHD